VNYAQLDYASLQVAALPAVKSHALAGVLQVFSSKIYSEHALVVLEEHVVTAAV
jgi:hypothetical protein